MANVNRNIYCLRPNPYLDQSCGPCLLIGSLIAISGNSIVRMLNNV